MNEITQLSAKGLGSQNKYVYTADEISEMLQISRREAYYLLHKAPGYKIIKFGRNIRADKASFDDWFHGEEESGPILTYTPEQVANIMIISVKTARSRLMTETNFRVLKFGSQIIRVHKTSFDKWLGLMSS